MVRASVRPEGVNAALAAPNAANVVNSASTADTEETDLSPGGNRESRASGLPVSLSSSSFAQVKGTVQRAIRVTPPPPYEVNRKKVSLGFFWASRRSDEDILKSPSLQAVAIDIDKEEEAIRSGIERCELALKAKLVPPLSKNSSLDSENTNSDEIFSACTTQPLDDRLEPSDDTSLEAIAIVEPLLSNSPSISFSSNGSSQEGSPLETSNDTAHDTISASPEDISSDTNPQNPNVDLVMK